MQTASAEQQKHETKTTFYSGGCDYVGHSVHSPTIIFYLWRITIDDYGTTSAGMITKRNIFHFVDVTEPHVCVSVFVRNNVLCHF